MRREVPLSISCYHLSYRACDVFVPVMSALQQPHHVLEKAVSAHVLMETINEAVQRVPIELGWCDASGQRASGRW